MSSIKILSKRPVFAAELFDVYETKFDLNGQTYTHHNIHRPSVASIFPMTTDGELYMISQYRYLHEEVFFEEIAGHIDKGENPLEGAKRELKEEVGITAKKWEQFAEVVSSASVVKNKVYFFLAQDLSLGKATPEAYEEISLKKISLSDAVKDVFTGKIRNSSAMLGILMLSAMKQEGKI